MEIIAPVTATSVARPMRKMRRMRMKIYVEGYSGNQRFDDVQDLAPGFGDFVKINQGEKITLISKREIISIEIECDDENCELVIQG